MVIFWYSIGFHSYVSSPEVIHHGIHIYIHIMGWLGWFPLLTFANYMIYALVTNIHILHIIYWLVVWNINYIFPLILGISSSQLTHIFQRGGPGPPTSLCITRVGSKKVRPDDSPRETFDGAGPHESPRRGAAGLRWDVPGGRSSGTWTKWGAFLRHGATPGAGWFMNIGGKKGGTILGKPPK